MIKKEAVIKKRRLPALMTAGKCTIVTPLQGGFYLLRRKRMKFFNFLQIQIMVLRYVQLYPCCVKYLEI